MICCLRNFTFVALTGATLAACSESGHVSSKITEAVPVVWSHPTDPSKTYNIGPGTDGGLAAVDPEGLVVGQFGEGDVRDVEVRGGIVVTTDDGNPDTATPLVIVAATDSADKTIMVAALNSDTGKLSTILEDPIPSSFDNPFALCLYKSEVNGNLYVFAADTNGTISQWLLYDSGLGTLRHTIMRTWSVGDPIIDCKADDLGGSVDVTVTSGTAWRYGAEPKDNFNQRKRVN